MNFCCRIMSSSSRHENLGVWVLIAMVSYLDFSPAYPKWSDFLSSERYRANSQQRRRHLRQISFKLFLKGHLFLVVVVLQIKIIHVWLIRSIVSFTTLWRILLVGTPDTLRKFLPFSPPPPRNFHWPSWGVWTISGITHSVYKIYTCRLPGEEYPQSHSGVRKWVLPHSRTPSVLYSYSWCQVTSVLYIVWGTLVLHSPAVNVRIYCTNQTTAGLQEQLFELDI